MEETKDGKAEIETGGYKRLRVKRFVLIFLFFFLSQQEKEVGQFPNLVVKCILKLTKVVDNDVMMAVIMIMFTSKSLALV